MPVYSSKILTYNYLFLNNIFIWYCYQGDSNLMEIWECSLLFNFCKYFEKDRCKFFLVEFPVNLLGSELFGDDFGGNFLKLIFTGVQLIYNVVSVSGVQQSESVMHIHISLFLRFYFHVGHYKVLNRVPCAIY